MSFWDLWDAVALLQGCSLQGNTALLLGAVDQQRWASYPEGERQNIGMENKQAV